MTERGRHREPRRNFRTHIKATELQHGCLAVLSLCYYHHSIICIRASLTHLGKEVCAWVEQMLGKRLSQHFLLQGKHFLKSQHDCLVWRERAVCWRDSKVQSWRMEGARGVEVRDSDRGREGRREARLFCQSCEVQEASSGTAKMHQVYQQQLHFQDLLFRIVKINWCRNVSEVQTGAERSSLFCSSGVEPYVQPPLQTQNAE